MEAYIGLDARLVDGQRVLPKVDRLLRVGCGLGRRDPLGVRPKAHVAVEVEREVRAERRVGVRPLVARIWHGVDEVADAVGATTLVGCIVALECHMGMGASSEPSSASSELRTMGALSPDVLITTLARSASASLEVPLVSDVTVCTIQPSLEPSSPRLLLALAARTSLGSTRTTLVSYTTSAFSASSSSRSRLAMSSWLLTMPVRSDSSAQPMLREGAARVRALRCRR